MVLDGSGRVALIAAMVPELEPLVRALRLAPAELSGLRVHRGTRGALDVVAAVTTMGTRPATDVTTRLLDAGEVRHVIVVGICGAIDPALAIGDLIVPERVLDEASGTSLQPVALGTTAPRGVLLTTDTLHVDPATIAGFARRGVVAVDMETAAIGMVCAARGVPWSVFRAISDRAGDPDVDPELIGMSNPDGTPNARAVVRYLLRHPARVAKLARLGAGLRSAVRRSTDAALAVLRG